MPPCSARRIREGYAIARYTNANGHTHDLQHRADDSNAAVLVTVSRHPRGEGPLQAAVELARVSEYVVVGSSKRVSAVMGVAEGEVSGAEGQFPDL